MHPALLEARHNVNSEPAEHDEDRGEATLGELGAEAVRVLQWQLYLTSRVVAAKPLAALRRVPIWLELPTAHAHGAGAEYHWGPQWLTEHGRNPAKVKLALLAAFLLFLFFLYLSAHHLQPPFSRRARLSFRTRVCS